VPAPAALAQAIFEIVARLGLAPPPRIDEQRRE
jgi:hypothetical protein